MKRLKTTARGETTQAIALELKPLYVRPDEDLTGDERGRRDELLASLFVACDGVVRKNAIWFLARRGLTRKTDGPVSYRDLVSEGRVGLLNAIRRWDPERGAFITAATWSIRERQLVYLRQSLSIVSLDSSAFGNRRTGEAAVRFVAAVSCGSLSETYENDEEQRARLVATDPSLPVDVAFEEEEFRSALAEALEQLEASSPRHAYVLRRRYLSGDNPPQLEQLGEEIGVSRERVRQVIEKAIRKLRAILHQTRRDVVPVHASVEAWQRSRPGAVA